MAALANIARGIPVFPIHTRTDDGACSCGKDDCGSPAKHPLTRRGLLDASKDPEIVAGWWQRWPWANIGMPTGKASGIVVLDIDRRHNGFHTLAKLIASEDEGMLTLEVMTGGGGAHLWFWLPDGAEITNSNTGITDRFGPGIDVRGIGGYVLIPPSLHISGNRYAWGLGKLQTMPAWLLEVLNPPPPPPRPVTTTIGPANGYTSLDRYWRKVFKERLAELANTTVNRNEALNEASFRMGQIIAHGAPEADIRAVLARVGVEMGLTQAEVGGPDGRSGTVNSGIEAGKKEPDPWFRGVNG